MCGITGIVAKNSRLNPTEIIKNLSTAIRHRGPDDYAEFLSEKCAMAIRRLAIQDLTIGLYPFYSDDKSLSLVLNGEIYNFPALKEELRQLGFNFKTNCDAEAILYGYQKWGNAVFTKLRGMFAISIWDARNNKLILVRDRMGIKPIYYFENEEMFLFSSEAKSIINMDRKLTNISLDDENIETILGYMFLPKSEQTLVKGIKKVPPATILEYYQGKVHLVQYWKLETNNAYSDLTFNQAVEKLDTLLNETVKMHLLSDAPLGVLLSGGLDSALITAIMSRYVDNSNLKTFTAKFNHRFNESELAAETARYLDTKHTELLIDTTDITNNIENYIDIFDDLTTFDGGVLTTQLLCKKVSETGIKVLLLGEGADELFGGYSWFSLSKKPFNFLPTLIRNSLYYYSISRNVNFDSYKYAKQWNNISINGKDVFKDISYRELFLQLPNHLLMKVDKGSMASSVEARVPYLDHELVKYVYNLPSEYKLFGDWVNLNKSREKYILREVAKKYLPETVVNRKKRGFLLPMNDILNENLDKVKSYVLSPDAISSKYITLRNREKLFLKSSLNLINTQNEYLLWRLYILEVWAAHFRLK